MKHRDTKGRFAEHSKAERLIIAIGDAHGCVRAVKRMIKKLGNKYDLNTVKVLFLGDYADRGESTKDLIEYLIKLQKQYSHFEFILGNHELLILQGEPWGVQSKSAPIEGRSALADYPGGVIPATHWEFLRGLKPYYESENFVFVHGGIPVGYESVHDVPVSRLVWEYQGAWRGYKGKKVVCGHHAASTVRDGGNFLCIDTGCTFKFGGKLTAAVLSDTTGKTVEYIQVENPMYEGVHQAETLKLYQEPLHAAIEDEVVLLDDEAHDELCQCEDCELENRLEFIRRYFGDEKGEDQSA